MENMVVRLENIYIENFKNIITGNLSFKNNRKNYKASILGLYGQNGSGKTALIDSIEILKLALSGQEIPARFADAINVSKDIAHFHYEFSILGNNRQYLAHYEFKLRAEIFQNLDIAIEDKTQIKSVIFDEILSYSYKSETENIRKEKLIDTSFGKVFSPESKYNCLIGKDKDKKKRKETEFNLIVSKKLLSIDSKSFIFSKELLDTIEKNNNCETPEYTRHKLLLDSLINFAKYELFIINTRSNGIISLNALPLSFKYQDSEGSAVGAILIPLDKAIPIPQKAVSTVEKVIENMNIVLAQIIPGLTISVKELGATISSDGILENTIQLMSLKNKKEIPLQYESEGIKKIISILQLLIVIYNKTSITVAIDELDSGIFEYLLGELLRIISEKGKGQLIFTCHNLRPLETIDKGFIAFTTTNPNNRYIRMSNVKENNNLRDYYFRDIVLGEQNEAVYETTNNSEIALAFRKAGEIFGS